jgi:diguanylate cyclase (GGDEF)-like protein
MHDLIGRGRPRGGTVEVALATLVSKATRRLVLALLALSVLPSALAAPMDAAWREVQAGDTPARVLDAFERGEMAAFDPSRPQRIARPGQAVWIVLRPHASSAKEELALTITPPPLSPVTLYDRRGRTQTLALDDAGAHGHGRLAWKIAAGAAPASPLLLHVAADPDGIAPMRFGLGPWGDYLREDARWLMFSTACFAVMLAMAAMATCLALLLRAATFAWYAGYVACYAVIQGVQSGYAFHPMEWTWLAGVAPVVDEIATLLSLAFAAAFVARFCELRRFAPVLHTAALALALGVPLLTLMRISRMEALVAPARALLYPALALGAVLLLYAGMVAAWRGSRHARYFLIGLTPLLALTAMSSARANGAVTGMDNLDDAALAAGAVQALVLALGLADRVLAMRHDTDAVRRLADIDALTRVLNRRAWSEGLQAVLAECENEPLAVLFLDMDHFKTLNDCRGHRAGDCALVAAADALRHELRPEDLLGRYGGEEFVAALRGTERTQAVQIATRLCRRVHRLEIPVDDRQHRLTVSIGVAVRRPDDTVESLVERADQAMYRAKLAGRNGVCVEELHADRRERDWPTMTEEAAWEDAS